MYSQELREYLSFEYCHCPGERVQLNLECQWVVVIWEMLTLFYLWVLGKGVEDDVIVCGKRD